MNKKSVIWMAMAILLLFVAAGCGKQQAVRPQQEVAVKAMQVIQKDSSGEGFRQYCS
ncbi:MAG: acrA [Firmicutes bacterium]|nr:acrA [Bacillota bacterium]